MDKGLDKKQPRRVMPKSFPCGCVAAGKKSYKSGFRGMAKVLVQPDGSCICGCGKLWMLSWKQMGEIRAQ